MINFVEHAEKLIKIHSISNEGNEEIAVYLQSLMNRLGMKTSLQEVTHSMDGVSKRQFNAVGILGDPLVDRKTKKGLLLTTHVDTVPPGLKSHWTECADDPFNMVIKDNEIFGLGSADAKLDFLCKLKAVERYKDRRLKMPIYLAATAGEEMGMIGAKFLTKSLALNPKYVLIGKPTDLGIVHSHKAYAVYQISIGYNQLERDAKGYNTRIELQCMGRSAHGAYPQLGDNAIKRMLGVVQKIKEANFQIKLTKISGGDYVNKVPDSAAVEFYLSSSSFDDFRKFYREQINHKDVRVEFGGLGESGMKFKPDNLLNAIAEIQGCMTKVEQDLSGENDATFSPEVSTINLGKVTHRPGYVDLYFDVRLLPSISPETFDQKFKAMMSELNTKFSNLIMKVNRNRFNPAFNISAENELVQVALEAQKSSGIGHKLDKLSVSTEASQYSSAGFDCIVFGPGSMKGNSHSPNEHTLVDQLDKAVHFYDRIIERYCL